MVKIFSSRGTGRSYQIARYAVENDCNIVVAYQKDIDYMKAILEDVFESDGYQYTKEKGYKCINSCTYIFRRRFDSEYRTIMICTADDTMRWRGYNRDKNIVIDDADRVLEYLFRPYRLQGITMDMN